MIKHYHSWCPELGSCHSRYREFKDRRERDFAASAARKRPGPSKARVSEYKYGKYKQHTAYTLMVWSYDKVEV